ncbi:MAG TPA: ATP-binding protein [Pirellulales bacterium]|nr:ATP-binding protein [Pirellulales bacterium]
MILDEHAPSDTAAAMLDAGADLEAVLAAWHGATLRLEQTHEALRAEVHRLSDELEIKNRELARKNRLADLGQVASHVAHEVRNNLVPVALYLSVLRRRVAQDPTSVAALDKIESGFTSLDATVNDLLNFAAERDPLIARVPLRPLIADLQSSLAPQLAAQGIEMSVSIPQQLAVWADRDMLRRAILNIALNALDAMPGGGRLALSASEQPDAVVLEIADTGPGLSDDAQRRAFEPFFTTKSTGTGLGLSIVYRTAEAHGGDVTVANQPAGGACFTLRLPHRNAEEIE